MINSPDLLLEQLTITGIGFDTKEVLTKASIMNYLTAHDGVVIDLIWLFYIFPISHKTNFPIKIISSSLKVRKFEI